MMSLLTANPTAAWFVVAIHLTVGSIASVAAVVTRR
jgi:hypothetical protein